MKKDACGISLIFYAVLAIVLAVLNQTLLCGLVLAYAILAVKDEWLIRQCMQALFLSLISLILSLIQSCFSGLAVIPVVGSIISGFIGVIVGIFSLILLIFAIIAICKVAKGNEANFPLLSTLADKAFGKVKVFSYPQPPMGANPQNPYNQNTPPEQNGNMPQG